MKVNLSKLADDTELGGAADGPAVCAALQKGFNRLRELPVGQQRQMKGPAPGEE